METSDNSRFGQPRKNVSDEFNRLHDLFHRVCELLIVFDEGKGFSIGAIQPFALKIGEFANGRTKTIFHILIALIN